MNYIHSHRPLLLARRVYMDAIVFGTSFHTWVLFGAEYQLRSWAELLAFGRSKGAMAALQMWFVKGDVEVQQIARRLTFIGQCMASYEGAEVDEHTLFVLSGQDDVISSYDVVDYCAAHSLPCTVLIDDHWKHGGFLWQDDPNQLWQKVYDWVSPDNVKRGMRRVKSDPSFRGHLFAAGS
jgi:hypothetical protein